MSSGFNVFEWNLTTDFKLLCYVSKFYWNANETSLFEYHVVFALFCMYLQSCADNFLFLKKSLELFSQVYADVVR